jgi:hypothetical protein
MIREKEAVLCYYTDSHWEKLGENHEEYCEIYSDLTRDIRNIE